MLSHIPSIYKDIHIAEHLGCETARGIHIYNYEEQGKFFEWLNNVMILQQGCVCFDNSYDSPIIFASGRHN